MSKSYGFIEITGVVGQARGLLRRLDNRPAQQGVEKEVLGIPGRLAGHNALCVCRERQAVERHSATGRAAAHRARRQRGRNTERHQHTATRRYKR